MSPLQNTPIKLATCNRCQAYVFACDADGIRTAADPAPLGDTAAYVQALTRGLRVFDLVEQAGRPHKLLTRTVAAGAPRFGAEPVSGAHSASPSAPRTTAPRPILAEHGCGAAGRDTSKAEAVAVGPPSAPATHGDSKAGRRPGAAPGQPQGSSQGPNPKGSPAGSPFPAGHASRLPSEKHLYVGRIGQPRCDRCGKRVDHGEEYIGIHCGRWIWAEHDGRCPNELVEKAAA